MYSSTITMPDYNWTQHVLSVTELLTSTVHSYHTNVI